MKYYRPSAINFHWTDIRLFPRPVSLPTLTDPTINIASQYLSFGDLASIHFPTDTWKRTFNSSMLLQR